MHSSQYALFVAGLLTNLPGILTKPLEPRQYFPYADCAYLGYSKNDGFASANSGTYLGCSTACFQYTQCKSFAFNNETGDCQIYDISVDDNLDLEYSSQYYFFDTACETTPECGLPGDDYRWRPFDYSNKVSEQNCKDKCVSLTNCKSYAYGNQECFLYDVPVKGNYNGRNNSPYLFNDRRCITNSTSGSTSTTLSKSTSTITKAGTSTSASVSSSSSTSKSSSKTSTFKTTTTSVTSTSKSSSAVTSTGKSSTSSKQTSTATRVLSTSVTISSQIYFCTAAS